MRNTRAAFLWLMLFCISATGTATAAPKPNFSKWMFLLGNWNCATRVTPGMKTESYVETYTLDNSGYWMNQRTWYINDAPGVITEDHYSYDPSRKRWVDVGTGNDGTYSAGWTREWNNNKLIWHDEVAFLPINPRVRSASPDVVTKLSDHERTAHMVVTRPNGRRDSVEEICTK